MDTIKIIFLCSILGGTACTPNPSVSESNRLPNVVFILVDDLGWTDLACYGSTFHETPNLDALAAEGVLFSDAYAASPVCSPTRAAILTGKYPTSVNITDWIPGQNPMGTVLKGPQDLDELPLTEWTLAEALKEVGYKTFFAGKWHLGSEEFSPENQGFEVNIGGIELGSPPGGYYTPYKNRKLPDGPEGEYLTDRLTQESIDFIEKNKTNPFLLYLSFYTVHTPIQASKRHLGKFQLKADSLNLGEASLLPERDGLSVERQYNPDYASMVFAMDENVGRLITKLKETKLWENTLLVFTSDNGGLATLDKRRNAAPTSNAPLRAGKGWCYEGGIRVPLIIKMPNTFATKDKVIDVPVISMDFLPTILAMVNPEKELSASIDGLSLAPLLEGKGELDRTSLFWHFPHYHGSAWTPGAAIRQGDWKLIEFYETDERELYNLKTDQAERNNLLETNPEKAIELKNKLLEMQQATDARFAMKNEEKID